MPKGRQFGAAGDSAAPAPLAIISRWLLQQFLFTLARVGILAIILSSLKLIFSRFFKKKSKYVFNSYFHQPPDGKSSFAIFFKKDSVRAQEKKKWRPVILRVRYQLR
jgi:hypothetical protein